jgi:hypothetical protein
MMLAESITWGQIGEISTAIAIVAGAVVAVIALNRKTVVKMDDKPPIEFRKAPKRYNHDLTEQRYAEVNGRLNDHDAELDSIWEEIAREDGKLRGEIQSANQKTADKFETIAAALGEIKGALGIKSQNK